MKETSPDALGALHANWNASDCVVNETADLPALMKAGGGLCFVVSPRRIAL